MNCYTTILGELSSNPPFPSLDMQDKYHVANEVMYREYGPVVREEVLWNFPLVHLFDRRDIERVLRYSVGPIYILALPFIWVFL